MTLDNVIELEAIDENAEISAEERLIKESNKENFTTHFKTNYPEFADFLTDHSDHPFLIYFEKLTELRLNMMKKADTLASSNIHRFWTQSMTHYKILLVLMNNACKNIRRKSTRLGMDQAELLNQNYRVTTRSVTKILREAEKIGMITNETSPIDNRTKVVIPTDLMIHAAFLWAGIWFNENTQIGITNHVVESDLKITDIIEMRKTLEDVRGVLIKEQEKVFDDAKLLKI